MSVGLSLYFCVDLNSLSNIKIEKGTLKSTQWIVIRSYSIKLDMSTLNAIFDVDLNVLVHLFLSTYKAKFLILTYIHKSKSYVNPKIVNLNTCLDFFVPIMLVKFNLRAQICCPTGSRNLWG